MFPLGFVLPFSGCFLGVFLTACPFLGFGRRSLGRVVVDLSLGCGPVHVARRSFFEMMLGCEVLGALICSPGWFGPLLLVVVFFFV